MDTHSFDRLTRLAAQGRSRRSVLKGLIAGALGLGVAAPALKATKVAAVCVSSGYTCSSDSDCCATLSCFTAFNSTPTCGLPYDATCTNTSEFCGQGLTCDQSTGTCKRRFNQACSSTAECNSECACEGGLCKFKVGSECDDDNQCVTGGLCCCSDGCVCVAGDCCSSGIGENNGTCPTQGDTCIDNVCTPPCAPIGDPCKADLDCCEGTICDATARTCQVPLDGGCTVSADCATGLTCDPASQSCRIEAGEPCDGDQCVMGLVCREGVCTIPTASITVHLRCCPEGATDVFGECHDNGIADVAVALDGLLFAGASDPGVYAGVTDEHGNFTFIIESKGPWQLSAELDGAPISMYCSYVDEVGTETYLDIADGITLPEPFTAVVCDVYYAGVCEVPSDGGEEPGGDTELPETGAGTSATSLIAGAAIVAGGAALLGKALKGNAEA